MIEAANTSETSVNFYQTTRRNIPEDSHCHSFLARGFIKINCRSTVNNEITRFLHHTSLTISHSVLVTACGPRPILD
jgi:hypothetical protein